MATKLGGANAGFHRTDTTDLGVVLSGKPGNSSLDDGAEVSLSPGDVLIENGTRHRWRVVGNVPATLASFIIGSPAPLGSALHVRWTIAVTRGTVVGYSRPRLAKR